MPRCRATAPSACDPRAAGDQRAGPHTGTTEETYKALSGLDLSLRGPPAPSFGVKRRQRTTSEVPPHQRGRSEDGPAWRHPKTEDTTEDSHPKAFDAPSAAVSLSSRSTSPDDGSRGDFPSPATSPPTSSSSHVHFGRTNRPISPPPPPRRRATFSLRFPRRSPSTSAPLQRRNTFVAYSPPPLLSPETESEPIIPPIPAPAFPSTSSASFFRLAVAIDATGRRVLSRRLSENLSDSVALPKTRRSSDSYGIFGEGEEHPGGAPTGAAAVGVEVFTANSEEGE